MAESITGGGSKRSYPPNILVLGLYVAAVVDLGKDALQDTAHRGDTDAFQLVQQIIGNPHFIVTG